MSPELGPLSIAVRARVNGRECTETVPPRLLLSDFLRSRLRLTGTHVGCEHGVCGACTVLLDGEPVRSCLLLAVQADGARGHDRRGPGAGRRAPSSGSGGVPARSTALQCGFCTPGILMTVSALLEEHPRPSDEEIRGWLSGNLCRCTGYQNIVRAVRRAGALLAARRGPAPALREAPRGHDDALDRRAHPAKRGPAPPPRPRLLRRRHRTRRGAPRRRPPQPARRMRASARSTRREPARCPACTWS